MVRVRAGCPLEPRHTESGESRQVPMGGKQNFQAEAGTELVGRGGQVCANVWPICLG